LSKKKQLNEQEIKELRRKQQEKAMQFQLKINDNIKNSYQALHAKSKGRQKNDDSGEEKEETDEEEEENKQDINEFNDLKFTSDQFDQMMIDEKNSRKNNIGYNKMFDEMLKEYDKNIDRKNNELISKEIERNFNQNKQKNKKSVKWSDEKLNKITEIEKAEEYDSDDYEEDDDFDEYDSDEETEEDHIVKVEPGPLTIHIKHTKTVELDESDMKLKLSREKPQINSPGDIYTHFYKPKSILKSSSITSISSDNEIRSSDDNEKSQPVIKADPKNAELGKFEPEKVRFISILTQYFDLLIIYN
jgi:hypothetical protein